MPKESSDVLVLKLGGKCNLRCLHCHCTDMDFVLNEDIFGYILNRGFKRITFSGGEPLLYYDVMKMVMERCGHDFAYKFVTNGTLITDERVTFFNGYDTYVCVSYDGEDSGRDRCDPKYRKIGRLNNNGLAVTVYNENMDFEKLGRDIARLQFQNELNCWQRGLFFPNFIHQTAKSPGMDVTKELVESYVTQFARKLELDFIGYTNGIGMERLSFLCGAIKRWFGPKRYEKGVRCCNPHTEILTLAGDFLLCPYSYKKVGDIYSGIDYDLVDSYQPERCKACELWEICKNPCVENVTENECYIFKTLYRHFLKLLKKYDVLEGDLCKNIRR